MTEALKAEYKEELKQFKEKTAAFYRGEIPVAEYKGFSGYYGSYAQRGAKVSMLRLRMTGGKLDKAKLKFIAESIEKYGIDKAHFTTCQTVQLHNLSCEAVCSLIEEAVDYDIITRGGGGDFPRNTMCSPLSGVEPGENFDVMPYAQAAGEYLLGLMKGLKLPRKLKVAFSNGAKNETHATFRDLGFVAKENQKFDVYCAGGLGNKPKFGVKVAEDIEPAHILYCVQTMVDVFQEHGNYKQRGASRTRFLQDTMGVEGLQEAYAKKLEENRKNLQLDVEISAEPVQKTGDAQWDEAFLNANARVQKQKQNGLYMVYYHPVGGVPAVSVFPKLYHVVEPMEQVEMRLAPEEAMYIINLTKEEAEKVLAVTSDSATTLFEESTACIGADICQVGIGLSQKMLDACISRVKKEQFSNGVLPKIHISGCPSSCSAHQTAAIGLRGGKKPSQDGPKDAFAIYINGCALQGKERMGEELGVMYAEEIPEFFVQLGREIQKAGLTYETFYEKYPERIAEIAKPFL